MDAFDCALRSRDRGDGGLKRDRGGEYPSNEEIEVVDKTLTLLYTELLQAVSVSAV
jgi:hypothetical protein